VVKADGYGLGAVEVATALAREGCDTFFVAHLGEGAALRRALGPKPAIYVLNGILPGAEDEAVAAGLVAVLNSAVQLQAWREAARRAGRKLPAAVQVDSGMSRLGMAPVEVEAIAADPQAFDGIDLVLVMSHLACADEPDHPANEAQRLEFERLRRKLPDAPASLANSSGIFLGPDAQFDLVRPGVALYGANPMPGHTNLMRPVVRLQARILQVRQVDAGEAVGYGASWTARRPSRIAILSVGYADGYLRSGSASDQHPGAEVVVAGRRCPLAGRISMDLLAVDVTSLPKGTPRRGDLAALIDEEIDIDDCAAHAGTIAYEILTGLGRRYHRVYRGG
jgi:alanine racemase